MSADETTIVGGSSSTPSSVPKRRRFASAYTDLFIIPMAIGILAGAAFSFVNAAIRPLPEIVGNALFILLNIGWLIFRDVVFAPGRHFMWRRVINIIAIPTCIAAAVFGFTRGGPVGAVVAVIAILVAIISFLVLMLDRAGAGSDLKLVATDGGKVTFLRAVIRNLFLGIPVVLTTGYACELGRVFFPAVLARRIWYSVILLLTLLLGIPVILSGQGVIVTIGVIGAMAVAPFFLVKDRAGLAEGDRLMDVVAKTHVTTA